MRFSKFLFCHFERRLSFSCLEERNIFIRFRMALFMSTASLPCAHCDSVSFPVKWHTMTALKLSPTENILQVPWKYFNGFLIQPFLSTQEAIAENTKKKSERKSVCMHRKDSNSRVTDDHQSAVRNLLCETYKLSLILLYPTSISKILNFEMNKKHLQLTT